MTPDLAQLYDVIDGTWPAAETQVLGHVLLRRGDGGGQRVSAATALGPITPRDIDA
ncbi:MAG: GNAT family N-acetyltransferase, partial [Paracoccaceae bacterium]|nr:GNAT family N-acetyltransferase [Paracoccaceae bacterium]